ncbi:MAG: hypothetical protein KDD89_12220, partial [Anaerolineales bacterium]|nr:hypothetical protein [Anaerolineales bacterium]
MTDSPTTPTETPLQKALNNLKLRAIGPAVMGGRLSDIVIHPHNPHLWYIAAGSGNIWKTS